MPRSLARRAALLLAFAAAFLPALIPGLHGSHGMPLLTPVAQVAHATHEHHAVALGHHYAHGSGHEHAIGPRPEPAKTPTPASKRSDGGVCPICRTLQQLASLAVPDSAVLIAPAAILVEHVAPPVEAPTIPPHRTPSQPRAPPVVV